MTVNIGVVMDPIGSIKPVKDSTLAMLLEAQRRHWNIHYMEQGDLYIRHDHCRALTKQLEVRDDLDDWFSFHGESDIALEQLDVVLMRKDPPFDIEYIYTTYLLELAEQHGVLIVNKPQSLRDANEKLFTSRFPELTPETLVSRNARLIRNFIEEQQDVILKPLGGMGGASIFRVRPQDPNIAVILETLTNHGQEYTMAQRFIPEIKDGDKRILMIDGEPVPYTLARIPAQGETRGNLAAGGVGEGRPLEAVDYEIAKAVGPVLKEHGILFAGLDVIGDRLTEVNVTSPTCIRELDKQFNINIAGTLMDAIEAKLGSA